MREESSFSELGSKREQKRAKRSKFARKVTQKKYAWGEKQKNNIEMREKKKTLVEQTRNSKT